MRGLFALLVALALLCACRGAPTDVRVGSKKFTESVILGELASGLARDAGASVTHRRELGGTRILWSALTGGEIDLYAEYTGTLAQEILQTGRIDYPTLQRELARRGVRVGAPLGFDNTYALGMREERARALGIERIGQLVAHPELSFGLTSEFMDREDGWPGLSATYGLAPASVRGLDHDLAYRGLSEGSLDVIDVYTTDADIAFHRLRVLADDRGYFPEYQALFLYRAELAEAHPDIVASIERLAGRIDAPAMRTLNARVKVERESEAAVAAAKLAALFGIEAATQETSPWRTTGRHTLDHLALVATSLAAAILVAVPLGVLAARRRLLGQAVLAVTGLLQTIPSLALLVFMIPLLGIGAAPAIAALFLYSLLPIVRNTHAGLTQIPTALRESAIALGLSSGARLRLVELPLATPSILAGIKTAAVINVGTATLGALIGAGGLGEPILTGIRLADEGLILQGAVPAALLALVVQWAFDGLERVVVPRGLRLPTEQLANAEAGG